MWSEKGGAVRGSPTWPMNSNPEVEGYSYVNLRSWDQSRQPRTGSRGNTRKARRVSRNCRVVRLGAQVEPARRHGFGQVGRPPGRPRTLVMQLAPGERPLAPVRSAQVAWVRPQPDRARRIHAARYRATPTVCAALLRSPRRGALRSGPSRALCAWSHTCRRGGRPGSPAGGLPHCPGA